ncbi:hypothetical protein ASE63_25210 [Bosea sp. Root381]|uniref:hypothetical protein n=1 Tax=Bosea sp. Root381 TaxID=1736524 RepID=UPI0007012892|nr:hypothetical protein [Bosea sp. Root381]KRE04913.1 hypothetical protein ASE63_25210 [Bosea sp. Root381]
MSPRTDEGVFASADIVILPARPNQPLDKLVLKGATVIAQGGLTGNGEDINVVALSVKTVEYTAAMSQVYGDGSLLQYLPQR